MLTDTLSQNLLTDAPGVDVVEVSIFGPGRGESIAVHVGDSRWIIVDSCVGRKASIPVLEYLSSIGVDLAKQVRLVVATHAHDDHFAGIARVFEACESAKFVCSSALTAAEFIALTDLEERDYAGLPTRAYSEYHRIFTIIESREAEGFEPVEFASARKHLFTDVGPTAVCDVIAISPSSKAYKRSMRMLRKSIPRVDAASSVPRVDANDFAVGLWIEVAEKRLLLGADLLKGPDGFGWHAVLADPRPDRKASLFKVSHHGSVSGHRDGVWSELLVKSPLALLTPYRPSRIPNERDRNRILGRTDQAYITAPTVVTDIPRSARREAAAMGSLAQNVRPHFPVGQVRARAAIGQDEWHVEVVVPARYLNDNFKSAV